MSDSLCSHIQIDPAVSQNLITYLTQNKIEGSPSNGSQILKLFYEKDEIIRGMQNQITKYKAEQMRNNKMIAQLQQKISQICPNNNNTGSSFMMASEFKDYFQDFIKNSLSAALSPLLEYPTGYCQYSTIIFSSVYESINTLLSNKMNQICEIINIQQNAENRHKIKNCLLKILQDDWQALLGIQSKEENQQLGAQGLKQTSCFIRKALDFQNQQILQLVESQQFKQMDKKLVKICGYMILQQKKWEFLLPPPNSKKIEKYNKKDYVCIDGWIKQKEDVLIVLEGLAKESDDGTFSKHPNLKNYVIPYSTSIQQQFKLIPKNIDEVSLKDKELMKIKEIEQNKKSQTLDKSCQYSILLQQKKAKIVEQREQQNQEQNNIINSGKVKTKIEASSSNKKIKSKSTFFTKKIRDNKQNQQPTQYQQRYKQKIQTAIRKLSKIQQKLSENYFDSDSVSVMLASNINAVNLDQIKQRQSNQGLKLHNIQNICENNSNGSLCLIKSSKIQKNSSKNSHNLISDPSFEEILTLPQRKKEIADQLPLKRQSSRAKKSSSRKTSAGKIIVQCLQSKENIQNKNNREQTREKQNSTKEGVYKEMIRQKLGETKPQKQKEKQKEKQKQKLKDSKNKHKEQDRPLRIMHFKKIRQKYLNL